eukprot:TRINITY_DN63900_c0_g1_i1.p1 TRINITY_DN63900_c0_g1~~TRINITY_DN63900_c0_g1_i1.p1  ORF type:complete len:612 (-),score=68.12 TRINITY_DN63900_c0_g1_i1:251-2086(-)
MSLAACILLSCSAAWVTAFPSFRKKVPNGFRVACPTDSEGCSPGDAEKGEPNLVCNGIGHRTCAGATMPLNPFGKALEDHNYTWSKALCREDSDGDGLTNGEELGDPCCLWEEHDTPSSYTQTFAATHPGVATSAVANYVRPDCKSTAPEKKATKLNHFNSWEEQRHVDLLINNFKIPAKRTTYVDMAWNFPDDSEELFHAVFAEAIVRNAKNLHHYVVRGCPFKWPASKHGKPLTRQEASRCTKQWGAWAPGKKVVETPPWLGEPIGKKARIESFVVNVHYDNPTEEAGLVSNDGMRIFYTPTLRNETLGDFPVSEISLNPQMWFPPGKARNFMTRSCKLEVQDKQGNPAEFHLFAVFYHAHLLGRSMYTELTQDGKTIDLGSEEIWHFDDQSMHNLLPMNVTVRTGDHIQGTCIMDSTGRTMPTSMGLETTDEMCWVTFQGWPDDVQAKCSGHIWLGELKADESGFGLAQRHPVSQATDVWDGTNVRFGGAKVMDGNVSSTCSDNPEAAEYCPIVIPMLQAQSQGQDESLCTADLSRLAPQVAGQTMLSLCCTVACSTMCKNHELCQTTTTTTTESTIEANAAMARASGIVVLASFISALLVATNVVAV